MYQARQVHTAYDNSHSFDNTCCNAGSSARSRLAPGAIVATDRGCWFRVQGPRSWRFRHPDSVLSKGLRDCNGFPMPCLRDGDPSAGGGCEQLAKDCRGLTPYFANVMIAFYNVHCILLDCLNFLKSPSLISLRTSA